ncbi:hypothetical protein LCGC14_1645250 [marine sediment metagenome]|uniref:Uncharacterized protein n=1 Tax=marine sediment metagenome TaxID=412755 RepID=A0A0F9HYF1_9ZZZZ
MSEENEQQKEIIALMKRGYTLIVNFQLNVTTFRVIKGARVMTYPLEILNKMNAEGIIEFHRLEGRHCTYKLKLKRAHAQCQ